MEEEHKLSPATEAGMQAISILKKMVATKRLGTRCKSNLSLQTKTVRPYLIAVFEALERGERVNNCGTKKQWAQQVKGCTLRNLEHIIAGRKSQAGSHKERSIALKEGMPVHFTLWTEDDNGKDVQVTMKFVVDHLPDGDLSFFRIKHEQGQFVNICLKLISEESKANCAVRIEEPVAPVAPTKVKKLSAANTRSAINVSCPVTGCDLEEALEYQKAFEAGVQAHPEWNAATVKAERARIERMIEARTDKRFIATEQEVDAAVQRLDDPFMRVDRAHAHEQW